MTTAPNATTADMLDFVVDNQAERRREIYRNGRLVATCPANFDARLLKAFRASGPFGTFPDVSTPERPL